MYEMLKEFIKPELLVLIPVLYLCGTALKKSEVADRFIPFILGVSAVILSFLYLMATSDTYGAKEALMLAFSSITQGILCAGASVYANQLVKQARKDD